MSSPAKTADHRRLRRKKVKRGTSLCCRKGTLGLGKDIALALQDLSEEGAKLLVKEDLAMGTEVELTLTGFGAHKRVVALGTIVWCKPEGISFSVGVRLRDRLPYVDFFNLT